MWSPLLVDLPNVGRERGFVVGGSGDLGVSLPADLPATAESAEWPMTEQPWGSTLTVCAQVSPVSAGCG
jgi:hypothetical protein